MSNLKTAVVAIARLEGRYLQEWIEHNLSLGFDQVIIADNNHDEDGEDIAQMFKDNPNVIVEDYRNRLINKLNELLENVDSQRVIQEAAIYADKITTVSKTYAKEIQTAYYGEGLDGLLRQKSAKLVGITNGIDYSSNDPKKDKYIVNYGLTTLKNKAVNKEMLQQLAGLPVNSDVPVIAMVTRLVKQKGLDLVTRVIEDILKMNVQLIVLGTGDNDYQDFFEYYASSYPAKIASFIQFNNAIASKVYAGSDILLMPSLFEPCGLSQMIAMAYGTLPLVRETGGLSDTVIPYNEFTGDGNGFSFTNYNAHDMLNVIEYAVSCYQDKKTWTKLVKNAMRTKFEWKTQADEYLKIYNEIVEE